MKTKRLISAVLIFAFVFTLMPVMSTAATASTEDIVIKVLVEPSLAYDRVSWFSEGLADVMLNGKYGYIDKLGKLVIPLEYDAACLFDDGLAAVCKNGKWGYIDKTGKVMIPFVYDHAYAFSEGLAGVLKSSQWGYIDKKGKTVIPFEYDTAYIFKEGLACVFKNGKYGYIDKTGKIIIPIEYDATTYLFNDGLTGVKKGGKWGIINKTGKTFLSFEYNGLGGGFHDGLIPVYKENSDNTFGGKWGYMDKTGKIVIPVEYIEAYDFIDGLAVVRKRTADAVWGIINKTGKIVLPIEYNHIYPFSDGLATVLKNGKYSVIDKTGKIVLSDYEWVGAFNDGVAYAIKNGKKYAIDKTGKMIAALDFGYVEDFHEGLAFVRNGAREWGIIQILKVGYPIGDVLYSDITAYINDNAIPTSVINGKTLVVVEDLLKYGFDVKWDGNERTLKVEINKSKKITPLPVAKDTAHKPGTFKCKYLYTDIKTYLSGVEVESYAINGVTLIDFELLAKYGKLTWDGKTREIRLTIK